MIHPTPLPPVEEQGPVIEEQDIISKILTGLARPTSSQSIVLLQNERPGSSTTQGSRATMNSFFGTNNFNRFRVDDLTSYSMSDQRWTLQRKKIGLKRKTIGVKTKRHHDKQTREITLRFLKSFMRKECIRYVKKREENGENICWCGLQELKHKNMPPSVNTNNDGVSKYQIVRKRREHMLEISEFGPDMNRNSARSFGLNIQPAIEEDDEKEIANDDEATTDDQQKIYGRRESNNSQRIRRHSPVLASTSIIGDEIETPIKESKDDLEKPTENAVEGDSNNNNSQDKWEMDKNIQEYPTNSFGMIDFLNETSGSSKPAKYVRVSNITEMDSILTLLVDYWKLTDPARPSLVISVTGGAKNFKLDGHKKVKFNQGLLNAVRSTNAWIISGGMNIGVMKAVGEAVNLGQNIVKIKRKNLFDEESLHFVRGIKCIGVAPWGYIKNYEELVNSDPSQFSNVKYKIDDKHEKKTNVSLNGDHTHFLLVDNGMRNSFSGADKFRTRLEEAIEMPEPQGLGVPVVMILLDGGLSSIVKCSMALKRGIPVVVVAGSGRASDLIAFAFCMSVKTNSGEYALRKYHWDILQLRVESEMIDYDHKARQTCLQMIVQCCKYSNLITIYDIDSDQDMDQYILYALLKGRNVKSEASRLDQLYLSVLWNRPDIAESHIFKSSSYWPTSSLEDLMTIALLEEKVEFVKLFIMNGLVTSEYLTVSNLRKLYNDSCHPNKHITKLLQRTRHSSEFYLKNVHDILIVLIGQHNDSTYLADTRANCLENTHINHYTFEDAYRELFIWAIFTHRGELARFLWERTSSPLTCAVIGSCLYRALWRSLGAKNSELRAQYMKYKKQFEQLSVQFLEECYSMDPSNAMGIVERRNKKWGELDCLELGLSGNAMNFVASSCCQTSVDLSWQRGMIKLPSFWTLIAIFLPLLLWTRLFRFQKIGDNGGELTKLQKLLVFYKTPKVKFYAHSMSFIIFLTLYSYVVLFDFHFIMATSEKLALIWLITYMMEEFNELLFQQSVSLEAKLYAWWQSVWNRFDSIAFVCAITAFILRLFSTTFSYGRMAYAVNTPIFFCRLLRIYHLHYSLGPKLVIFYRMLSEVAIFLLLLVIFILGYGLASQSLLVPSPSRKFDLESIKHTVEQVVLTPYWQMYGELQLDAVEGEDVLVCHDAGFGVPEVCENPSNYTWAVKFMLIFYMIIGNIMLLNLLIAVFTYVFDEVQENSMEIWKFERYNLIREYDAKPGLVPPFVIFEHIFRISKWFWKKYLRKKKENLEDFMSASIISLKIFEKEAITSYLSKVQKKEEATIEFKMAKVTEKIDVIAKFVEDEQEKRHLDESVELMSEMTDINEDELEDDGLKAISTNNHLNLSSSSSDDDDVSTKPLRKKQAKNKQSKRQLRFKNDISLGDRQVLRRQITSAQRFQRRSKHIRDTQLEFSGDKSPGIEKEKWKAEIDPDFITFEEVNRPSSSYADSKNENRTERSSVIPKSASRLRTTPHGDPSNAIETLQSDMTKMNSKIDAISDLILDMSNKLKQS